jgi:hypothetical protein
LYKNGLQPIVFSESRPTLGWQRDDCCFDLAYKESEIELFISPKQKFENLIKEKKILKKKNGMK